MLILLYIKDHEVKDIEYFKAKKDTKKFKKGQVVWVTRNEANHLNIVSKWRGKGRTVEGTMSKFDSMYVNYNPIIGCNGILTMSVTDIFWNRIHNH